MGKGRAPPAGRRAPAGAGCDYRSKTISLLELGTSSNQTRGGKKLWQPPWSGNHQPLHPTGLCPFPPSQQESDLGSAAPAGPEGGGSTTGTSSRWDFMDDPGKEPEAPGTPRLEFIHDPFIHTPFIPSSFPFPVKPRDAATPGLCKCLIPGEVLQVLRVKGNSCNCKAKPLKWQIG